ncbi:hypothetical protein M5D96_001382 [Drosophila gunungcola]|uniref:Uncharacterized protein n=1 Tax=Drosophila gunungcola TaxID=103775 RepID=A0A9Q0BUM9_9MUSC|nr:hypothetical protein M5D96_001382 [Drosophila gunungcola]
MPLFHNYSLWIQIYFQASETSAAMATNWNNRSLQRGTEEMDKLHCDLLEILRHNHSGIKRVLQSIHNLLKENDDAHLFFSSHRILKILSVVISESREEEIPSSRCLVANAMVCVHLKLRKIPADDGKLLLQQLLTIVTSTEPQPFGAQIHVHHFDNFLRFMGEDCFPGLFDAIQRLLESDKTADHKSACFLIRKVQSMCDIEGESGQSLLDALQCSGQQLAAYVDIMENLEEEKSYLSVSTKLSLLELMSSDLGERWLVWLRILCLRLLQDERVLVLRETLRYFLSHLSLGQLCRFNLLQELLLATNTNKLFDYEDPNCLKMEELEQFMKGSDVELLLEALVTIPWKSVFMLHWLLSIKLDDIRISSTDLLQKLCASVHALENIKLRQHAIRKLIHTVLLH